MVVAAPLLIAFVADASSAVSSISLHVVSDNDYVSKDVVELEVSLSTTSSLQKFLAMMPFPGGTFKRLARRRGGVENSSALAFFK